MSHHFDTTTARDDPRLNLCDFYLFDGADAETTAMVMTVNPVADATTAAPFHDEAIYAFRFDTDGDSHENVSFKVRVTGEDVEVLRVTGADGTAVAGREGVRAFAGVVLDPFAGDKDGTDAFKAAAVQGRYEPEAFHNRVNFFGDRTVAAIVVEVPNSMISQHDSVHAWATVSLCGHAPEVQVARWGLPLITHLYLGDDALRERFNRTGPSDDAAEFHAGTAATVARFAGLANTTTDAEAYGRKIADLFASFTLPYQLGTAASFDYAGFNGRALGDNVMDNMLSLLTNSPLGTGVAPDPARSTRTFPYLVPVR